MITPDLYRAVLLGYLAKHAVGAAAARTQRKIARDLSALGLAVSTRDVRDLLAELVDEGAPIGTTSAKPPGAFVCVAARDFRRAYRCLYGRLILQDKRCRKFKGTAREILSGQRHFDFLEARQILADLEAAPLLGGQTPPASGSSSSLWPGSGVRDGQAARAPTGGSRRRGSARPAYPVQVPTSAAALCGAESNDL